ncbi:MAG: inositol monophosphatase [Saprospiraceae bacterium]|nr:inositol monophosphatase [Saprospiraceae bacterium]
METEQELSVLARQASAVVRRVALQIGEAYGTVQACEVELKSRNSLVSRVDREAEESLVKGLRALLPDAGFLTEEGTVKQSRARNRWIIDPLDGTTNFLHGLPFFAISIALERDGQLVLGIVHEVSRNEHFVAWKDGGAWCNEQRISVSKQEKLADSLIATGFPYYDFSRTEAYIEVLKAFMRQTRGVRRIGSAALDLAYVACGRFEAFYEYALHPWDVAGGIVLVREAGGVVTDFAGDQEVCASGSEILAAGPFIHPLAQEQIKLYF